MPLILMLLLFLGISCGVGAGTGTTSNGAGDESRSTAVLEVSVGPDMVDCVGVGPRKCLVVDGKFFYDSIEGFDYEPGYRYMIRMERFDAWLGSEEPPQDASRYGYRLIEILEKVQEP